MKLKHLEVKNFRSIAHAKTELDDYTCIVGPNGAGKSAFLTALNVFFRETRDSSTALTSLA